MRLDSLLWFLRLAKTRSRAQRWIAEGHIRLNGVRAERQDQSVTPGAILTLPLARHVLVIEILALPGRRGPPEEARACYRELDAGRPIAIAGPKDTESEGHPPP